MTIQLSRYPEFGGKNFMQQTCRLLTVVTFYAYLVSKCVGLDNPTTVKLNNKDDKPSQNVRLSNAENTFSISASTDWTRDDEKKSGSGTVMNLIITKDDLRKAWINIDEDDQIVDIAKEAQLCVETAKQNDPDLNKGCFAESIKLDGEVARVVKYHGRNGDFAIYSANHDGKSYRITCNAAASDLASMQKQIDAVITSFKWEKLQR